MAKIISAFPCMGKTHCSKNNDRVLDLESSDYFFEKDSFEDLSNEEFKGLQNRIKRETGLQDYITAIIAAKITLLQLLQPRTHKNMIIYLSVNHQM